MWSASFNDKDAAVSQDQIRLFAANLRVALPTPPQLPFSSIVVALEAVEGHIYLAYPDETGAIDRSDGPGPFTMNVFEVGGLTVYACDPQTEEGDARGSSAAPASIDSSGSSAPDLAAAAAAAATAAAAAAAAAEMESRSNISSGAGDAFCESIGSLECGYRDFCLVGPPIGSLGSLGATAADGVGGTDGTVSSLPTEARAAAAAGSASISAAAAARPASSATHPPQFFLRRIFDFRPTASLSGWIKVNMHLPLGAESLRLSSCGMRLTALIPVPSVSAYASTSIEFGLLLADIEKFNRKEPSYLTHLADELATMPTSNVRLEKDAGGGGGIFLQAFDIFPSDGRARLFVRRPFPDEPSWRRLGSIPPPRPTPLAERLETQDAVAAGLIEDAVLSQERLLLPQRSTLHGGQLEEALRTMEDTCSSVRARIEAAALLLPSSAVKHPSGSSGAPQFSALFDVLAPLRSDLQRLAQVCRNPADDAGAAFAHHSGAISSPLEWALHQKLLSRSFEPVAFLLGQLEAHLTLERDALLSERDTWMATTEQLMTLVQHMAASRSDTGEPRVAGGRLEGRAALTGAAPPRQQQQHQTLLDSAMQIAASPPAADAHRASNSVSKQHTSLQQQQQQRHDAPLSRSRAAAPFSMRLAHVLSECAAHGVLVPSLIFCGVLLLLLNLITRVVMLAPARLP